MDSRQPVATSHPAHTKPVATSHPAHTKRVSLPIGNKQVEDLLLWRDPARTGVVFGVITLAYILLEWSHFNILTLLANLMLVLVSVTFVWNNIATFTNRPGVPIPRVLREGVGEREVKKFTEQATPVINKFLGFFARIASGKEVFLSAQVAGALFIFAKVARYFTSLGLFYTIVLISFTIPKAYELKKDDVDHLIRAAHDHVLELYNKFVKPYLKKIPKAKGAQGTYRMNEPSATGATSAHYPGVPAAADEPKKVM